MVVALQAGTFTLVVARMLQRAIVVKKFQDFNNEVDLDQM